MVGQSQVYIFIPLQEMKGRDESIEMNREKGVSSFGSEAEAVAKECRSLRPITG